MLTQNGAESITAHIALRGWRSEYGKETILAAPLHGVLRPLWHRPTLTAPSNASSPGPLTQASTAYAQLFALPKMSLHATSATKAEITKGPCSQGRLAGLKPFLVV